MATDDPDGPEFPEQPDKTFWLGPIVTVVIILAVIAAGTFIAVKLFT